MSQAEEAPAVAPEDSPDSSLDSLLDDSPEQRELQRQLMAHLEMICCDRDPLFSPLGHLATRAYVDTQLSQWGEVEAEEFEYNGQTYCNLVLDLPGSASQASASRGDDSSPMLLIGAHYDAVHGSPGADDNGTGVAALLAMAAAFAQQPSRQPLRLVAFDAEEYGCLGSRVHAQLMAEDGLSLRLMLSLEMLGYCTPQAQRYPADWMKYLYPKQGNFLALVGNPIALPDLWRLGRSLKTHGVPNCILPVPNRGEWLPRLRASDHAAFWDASCPAAMVTDTAEMRNPNYHQASDRIETLDLDFFTRVTQGLIAGLRSL
jgi:Zn-dependent M28 family amino/carboxypeptidase